MAEMQKTTATKFFRMILGQKCIQEYSGIFNYTSFFLYKKVEFLLKKKSGLFNSIKNGII